MLNHRVTRRELLVLALTAAVGAGASGCPAPRGDRPAAPPAAPPTTRPSVDEQTARLLLSDKRYILGRYAALLAAHPEVSGRVAPLVARHEDHREAVAAAVRMPLDPHPSASTSRRVPAAVEAAAADELAELAEAEHAAGRRRTLLVASATSGRLAALLASIGACESAHAVLLGSEQVGLSQEVWPKGTHSTREIAALQTALAAGHAAIYGYGVVGAHLPPEDRPRASAAHDEHRRLRDQLREEIRNSGAQPGAAAPAYDLPFDVTSAPAAHQLAAHVEEGIEMTYAAIVNVARTTEFRLLATRTLAAATVRRTQWGGALTAFPGLSTPAGF